MTTVAFSVSAIVLGIYALLMAGVLSVALVRAVAWHRQAQVSAAVTPVIQDALADYLAGGDDLTHIRELVRSNRRDVANAVIGFQGAVGGGALDRLCDLTLELAFVQDWIVDAQSRDSVRRRTAFANLAFVSAYEPCRLVTGDLLSKALDDPDAEVRLWGCRALIQSGAGRQVETVFERAVSQNLLMRILLTEALRRHAVPLCERAVPKALRSPDARSVLAVLDILAGWERGIPVDNMRYLLEHADKSVRIKALKLAPMLNVDAECRAAILRNLGDPDPEIVTVATVCAGRLKIDEALPTLARMLRLAPAALAGTAAAAMAEMPPRGWQALEEFSTSSNPVTAAAAEGALGRARRNAGL